MTILVQEFSVEGEGDFNRDDDADDEGKRVEIHA
jgi:hypothetical protein